MRADAPIDDSAVVDDMFGFLEDQKDTASEVKKKHFFFVFFGKMTVALSYPLP